jgi:hypothetical protein
MTGPHCRAKPAPCISEEVALVVLEATSLHDERHEFVVVPHLDDLERVASPRDPVAGARLDGASATAPHRKAGRLSSIGGAAPFRPALCPDCVSPG